jgi:hypothetical protein
VSELHFFRVLDGPEFPAVCQQGKLLLHPIMCLPWFFGSGGGPDHNPPAEPARSGPTNAAPHGHAPPPPSRPTHSHGK